MVFEFLEMLLVAVSLLTRVRTDCEKFPVD